MRHRVPGIPDDCFQRGNIPMTKQEMRILVMAKARIEADSRIIDIGAGTGSLSVEAALLAPQGRVIAIERNPEGVALIAQNAQRFGAENLEVIAGVAPDCLYGLPAADVILIGGSGGKLKTIIQKSDRLLRQGGRMVLTAVTVETLYEALQAFTKLGSYVTEAFGVQITRIEPVGGSRMYRALNPVYIVSGTKEGAE